MNVKGFVGFGVRARLSRAPGDGARIVDGELLAGGWPQERVGLSGDVALDGSDDLEFRLAFGGFAGSEGLGLFVGAESADGDHV